MSDRTEPPAAPDTPPASSPRLVVSARATALREESRDWMSWDLTPRQLWDLELLINGSFAPLSGFMTQLDYDCVIRDMRLSSGRLWPLPVRLGVSAAVAGRLAPGMRLALRDPEGVMLAALHVDNVWSDDAAATLGRSAETGHGWFVGGRVEAVQSPVHHDFTALRLTPAQVQAEITRRGWKQTIGLAPFGLLHRAEVAAIESLMGEHQAGVVVYVADGPRGDVHHYARMRCHRAVLARFPPGQALLVLSQPVGERRDARAELALAILQKQCGCTHVALVPDEASDEAGVRERGLRAHAREIGLDVIPLPRYAYVAERNRHEPADEARRGEGQISPPDLRRLLENGTNIPDWFTYPEIAEQLRRSYPPRRAQGLTVFFTGLSGSGKSTLANALLDLLLERGGRTVTLLDGDLARRHLSSELGFSKAHRTLNVRRIGYVASEITRSGGIAICALIAPHAAIREEVRRMIEAVGGFVLVHVATTLEVCESRDRKGLYAKARAGLLAEFTGISDPYEVPEDADLTINAGEASVAEAASAVLRHLEVAGYLLPDMTEAERTSVDAPD
ncbi:MAG: adenylyl-sulfate kinase [Vicinamibacterales bacterium]